LASKTGSESVILSEEIYYLAILNNGTVGLPVLEIFPEEVPGILKSLSPGFLIISCLLEGG
jgi:hypothetical protein